MENFSEIYKKAGTLMQSALKKYAEGDTEGGERDRAEANRLYDMAEADVNMNSDNILYGESRNFGIIYKVLESNTANLCEDKSKRRKFKNILKLIKEDKNLKKEFEFYDALTNPYKVTNPDLYVNEALDLRPQINVKETISSNEKLINEIRKNKIFEFVDIDDDTMKLYESIEYVLFNKPQLKTLSEYTEAKNCIVEHVTSKMSVTENVTEEKENIDEVLNNLVKKYDAILNEDEKNLIKTISEAKDKETLFNEYRNNTLDKINEVIKISNREDGKELKEISDNLLNKQYTPNTIFEDISEFIEIKNVLSEKI